MPHECEFEAKVRDRIREIHVNWAHYRSLAQRGYAKCGRGALLVDFSAPTDPQNAASAVPPYFNAQELKKRLSDPLSIIIRLHDYNPEREIVFAFLDFDLLEGQAIVLGEREDGVPREDDFDELGTAPPPMGEPTPPIVGDTPDSARAKDFDHLLEILNDKVTRGGEEALEPKERAVWDVMELKYQVLNGGFSQFFMNCGDHCKATGEALEAVGAERIADVFRRICPPLPEEGAASDDAPWDPLDGELAEEYFELWDEADSKFYELDDELPTILWDFWTKR